MGELLPFQGAIDTAPTTKMRKVPAGRPKNADVRSREHLIGDEVLALLKAAGSVGRHRLRDKTLILTAYRHGMRVSELIDLKWDQVDFKAGQLHVVRLKNGSPSTHFLEGDEMRALRRLKREYPNTRFIFQTERGGPLTRSTVLKMVARAGEKAGIPFPVHPHMLRHACGFYLANKGFDMNSRS